MTKKLKVYVITLSRVFPVSHPKAGQPTCFREKMANAIYHMRHPNVFDPYEPTEATEKYHTIRANYELWRKRFEQIERGEACLSIRQWTGKPYASKQIEIARLTKDDGIGLQKLTLNPSLDCCGTVPSNTWIPRGVPEPTLAKYDGLSYEDWKAWFKNYDFSKPFALIHFTKKRY